MTCAVQRKPPPLWGEGYCFDSSPGLRETVPQRGAMYVPFLLDKLLYIVLLYVFYHKKALCQVENQLIIKLAILIKIDDSAQKRS
jgi:hypothetical protein